ncbi:MAG TPA: glycosyltransferase, partial [Trueperaceae bacterium]|nr:glycosyltransferase [Trueperaceae bacterium]
RLAPEKGLSTLLDAWRTIDARLPLKIVGDGPMAGDVKSAVADITGVEWLGRRSRDEVLDLMRGAYLLVFPSTWYEGFPVTLAEAFACGLPVVTSDLGSMRSVVDDGAIGRRFPAGDANALAEVVLWAVDNPRRIDEMGLAARREYEERYSPETNYRQLLEIYQRAVGRVAGSAAGLAAVR